MYILDKYIKPGEQVLFMAKKIWFPILFLVLCFVLTACPISLGMLFIKEAFTLRLLGTCEEAAYFSIFYGF